LYNFYKSKDFYRKYSALHEEEKRLSKLKTKEHPKHYDNR